MTWEKDRGQVFEKLNGLRGAANDARTDMKILNTKFDNFCIKTTRDVAELKTKAKFTAGLTAAVISILTSAVCGTILLIIFMKGSP